MSHRSELMYRDLLSVIRGPKLGQGVARKVYQMKSNSRLVLKIETGAESFQNMAEWEMWSWVDGRPKISRWFAPCRHISSCGLFLIQDYVEPIRDSERPPLLPSFLSDLKRENFGMLDGKIVCADYGTVLSAIRDMPMRMKKAIWK